MSKKPSSKSIFTLTFVVESVAEIDTIIQDSQVPSHNSVSKTRAVEERIELEPCTQSLKVQYQLYPGQNYDVDIFIWKHVAKVCRGQNFTWVRTWELFGRKFLAFTISHAFPVEILVLKNFIATITSTGSVGRTEPTKEVYLPKLEFGEVLYFAPVIANIDHISIKDYVWNLIWKEVIEFIPKSYLDGIFDKPIPVRDVRHQDTALYYLKESIHNNNNKPIPVENVSEKKKDDKKQANVVKYGLSLSGTRILAGVGRVIQFQPIMELPHNTGEIFAFLSTDNIPANEDLPILFVNVESLFNIPLKAFKKIGMTHLYTKWIINGFEHASEIIDLNDYYEKKKSSTIKIDDHEVLILEVNANKITTNFLDDPFEIEIRGIIDLEFGARNIKPKYFGYEKNDKMFGSCCSVKYREPNPDSPIARTKINARAIGKGLNKFIKEEYPLFAPKTERPTKARDDICTNDINDIGLIEDKPIFSPSIILESQMTLEVSMGLVGCRPRPVRNCYTRLYIFGEETHSTMNIIRAVWQINEVVVATGPNDNFLSGFAIDTGNVVLIYLEGPRDGYILKIWEMTKDYKFSVQPLFSSFAKYTFRVYPELIFAVPFVVLKMFIPLTVFLACPPAYVRPSIPIPGKLAALKLGRIITNRFVITPCRADLPSARELQSFRLELCAPPRPPPCLPSSELMSYVDIHDFPGAGRYSTQTQTIVNWDDHI